MNKKIIVAACCAAILGFANSANAVPSKLGAGGMHSLVIDGTEVLGTGFTYYGVLGDLVPVKETILEFIPLGIYDVASVATARYLSVYQHLDGSVSYSGINFSRREIIRVPEIVPSVGIATDIAATLERIGVLVDGCAYVWDMQIDSVLQPVGLCDLKDISGGNAYFAATGNNGQAYTWGDGSAYGELGDGNFGISETPVVVELDTKGIRAGYTTAALVKNLTKRGKAWGFGHRGMLGNGNVETSPLPVDVMGEELFSEVIPGTKGTIGVTENRELFVWGWHNLISEKSNLLKNNSVPMKLVEASDVREAAIGLDHMIYMTNSGVVCTWGGDNYGQLGDSNGIRKETHMPDCSLTVVIVDPKPIVEDDDKYNRGHGHGHGHGNKNHDDDDSDNKSEDDHNRGHGNNDGKCDSGNHSKSCKKHLAKHEDKKSKHDGKKSKRHNKKSKHDRKKSKRHDKKSKHDRKKSKH